MSVAAAATTPPVGEQDRGVPAKLAILRELRDPSLTVEFVRNRLLSFDDESTFCSLLVRYEPVATADANVRILLLQLMELEVEDGSKAMQTAMDWRNEPGAKGQLSGMVFRQAYGHGLAGLESAIDRGFVKLTVSAPVPKPASVKPDKTVEESKPQTGGSAIWPISAVIAMVCAGVISRLVLAVRPASANPAHQ